MTHVGQTIKNVGIALVGGAVGYLAGVLSAPAAGRETRRRLGRRLEDGKEELQRTAEHTLRDAKRTLNNTLRG
jgi:gas vesicle protein